ncbi:Glycoside hydrolase [Globisporangium polare]
MGTTRPWQRMLLVALGAAAALASTTTTAQGTAAVAIAPVETTTTTTTTEADVKRCFPADFLFGSATAAYQVEGAWNETGRTPSIWDDFCREKKGLECANVADDFLHRYREDIQLMVASGLDTFRFSISWSRVMNWDAQAKKMKANAAGIAFYHALIDEVLRNKIVPIVTLYHWDLPSELHKELKPQGWINSDIIDHFAAYAELIFTEFGAKVDFWSTFNEPWTFVTQGYGNGQAAPGLKHSKTNVYTAAHNVLLSHGKAVSVFRELKKSAIIHAKARIGIVLNADFSFPLDTTSAVDIAAAARKMDFGLGWFLTPLVSGKYPDIMRERVGDRLPQFTEAEKAIVMDSYDLFMLNHYSSKVVTDCASPHSKVKCKKQTPGWERDLGIDETRPPEGARLSSKNAQGKYNCNWFTGYSPGYLQTIKWMHAQNPQADILLTENGWCGNETIDNMDQLWYYQTYIGEVHKAITQFKIPIIGYSAWSFVDNYEWGSFSPRFGLYYVNFTSETGSKDGYTSKATDLARIPRIAAKWYAQVAKTKCLDGFEVEGVPANSGVVGTTPQTTVALRDDAVPLRYYSKTAAAVIVCFAFASPALVWFMKRRRPTRRSLSATEATPLMHTE